MLLAIGNSVVTVDIASDEQIHLAKKLNNLPTAQDPETFTLKRQKQPSRGVLRKKCSENMQQIDRRTPMSKCDFNKVTLQIF